MRTDKITVDEVKAISPVLGVLFKMDFPLGASVEELEELEHRRKYIGRILEVLHEREDL